MLPIRRLEDIYPAVDELIRVLPERGGQKIANALHHRMYEVAWTSSSELYEELHAVLTIFVQQEGESLDEEAARQMNCMLRTIRGGLGMDCE